jgi:drug/metabolite transporter (DMT)-like permease
MMATGAPATVFGLSTAAAWGTADFSGGLASKRATPSFVLAVAHGFSLLLLASAAPLLRASITPFGLDAFLSGVFCGGGLIALYSALSRGSMGLSAATSGVVAAVIPVLYEWMQEGHAGSKRLVGFAVAALAIWLVAYTPDSTPTMHSDRRGLGLALLAGILFGAMLIYLHLAAGQGMMRALLWMRIASTSVAALSCLVLWIVQRSSPAGVTVPVGKTLLLAMLAGVLDTSGNLLYLFASLAGRLDVTAVLSSLYPAATMLLAAWLLKERATRSQAVGMALTIVAIVLISM